MELIFFILAVAIVGYCIKRYRESQQEPDRSCYDVSVGHVTVRHLDDEEDAEPEHTHSRRSDKDEFANALAAGAASYLVNRAFHNNHTHKETYDQKCNRALNESRDRIKRLDKDREDWQRKQDLLHTRLR